MTRLVVSAAITLVALSGCVAPELCTERSAAGTSSTASLSGEQTFTAAGDEGSVRFRATLRGLSELWPAEHPVRGGGLGVVLHLRYLDESETGGVATQMPRFRVDLASAVSTATSYAYATPAFPASTGVPFYLPLFGECYDEHDLNCCEYGSTECSLDVVLRYQRQEGQPFPPVVLRWEASASASVDTCPLADDAELVLEVQEP